MTTSQDNKAIHLKKGNLWLNVLTDHCHRDVIDHYHQLTKDHQKQQFLAVLKDNVITQCKKEELDKCIVYEIKPDNYYATLTEAIRSEGVEPNCATLEELPSWLQEQTTKYMKLLVHSKNVVRSMAFHYSNDSSCKDYFHQAVDFSRLEKILIKDLRFGTSSGCYIEGKLIAEPLVSTGVSTFMEDETGQYIMIGLYNFIPKRKSRNKEAAMKFPFGTRIRIAEPFFDMFLDGNEGVRVDEPCELKILNNHDEDAINIRKVREDARKFYRSGNYLEALQMYWSTLKGFPEVITLLNKRAQCEINLKQYEVTVLDAAAVLLLDDRNEKARTLYRTAATKLGLNQNKKTSMKNVWSKLLRALIKDEIDLGGSNTLGKTDKGNRFFKAGRYNEAKFEYTKALDDTEICSILSNIAVVCLKTEMYQTAIAVANASLRIAKSSSKKELARFVLTKAFSMVGEFTFAKICGYNDESLKEFWEGNEKPINFADKLTLKLLEMQDSFKVREVLKNENIQIDYLAPRTIRHDHITGKGRALIATRDISNGELLLVDHMIYIQSSSGESASALDFKIDDSNELSERLMKLTRYDGLLARKFLLLETKKKIPATADQRLPLVTDLEWFGYRSFSYLIPPFLPQTPYELRIEDGAVSCDLIRRLLDTNVFGWGEQPDGNTYKAKVFMLRMRLFNHSDNPNCTNQLVGDAAVVYAARAIKKGEELCINYGCPYEECLN